LDPQLFKANFKALEVVVLQAPKSDRNGNASA